LVALVALMLAELGPADATDVPHHLDFVWGTRIVVMFNMVPIWLWKSGLGNQTRLCSTWLVLFILHWPFQKCATQNVTKALDDNCEKCIAFI
jgi:hypothetical protein